MNNRCDLCDHDPIAHVVTVALTVDGKETLSCRHQLCARCTMMTRDQLLEMPEFDLSDDSVDAHPELDPDYEED